MFGNPETTPGGKALKYYSSVRLDIRRGEQIKNGTDVIGNKTNIKVVFAKEPTAQAPSDDGEKNNNSNS